MMLMTESGIMAEADARVFGMLMSANRTMRRLMAADRTVAGAYRRIATLRRMQEANASREHARADREIAKEFGGDTTAPGWGRTFKIKATPLPTQATSGQVRFAIRTSTSSRAIRAYAGPLLDKRGRVALFMDIKYRGLKSKGWRAGLSADHIEYIMRELALEMAAQQLDRPISNMGDSVEEIMACWRALEEIEQGYRANAKVQYRIVWNLPHQLDAEQRRAMVEQFCERTFARLGLPYAAAIHAPDPDGDQRNFHAHITFSTRPCERTADHEWAISEEKVNGLTDKAGLRLVRALGAAHMNRACRAVGLPTLYTHQTYAERGIDARRQKHVGPAAMAAHDRGEDVAVIAENAAIVALNEATVASHKIELQLDANQHLQDLLQQTERDTNRLMKVGAQIDAAAQLARQAGAMVARIGMVERSTHLPERVRVSALHSRIVCVQRQAGAPARRVAPMAPLEATHYLATDMQRRLAAVFTHAKPLAQMPGIRQIRITAQAMPQRLFATIPNRSAFKVRVTNMRVGVARAVEARGRIEGRMVPAAAVEAYRNTVAIVDKRLAEHRAGSDAVLATAMRATIMGSAAVRCMIENDRLSVDISALSIDERRAFDGLDRDAQRTLLMERYKADKRRVADEDARRRDAEAAVQRERDHAAQRSVAVAEACRIMRESRSRPYRRDGTTIYTDWTTLTPLELEVVTVVGSADPQLQAALRVRAAADAHADAIALARSASTPKPIKATSPVELAGSYVAAPQVKRAAAATHPQFAIESAPKPTPTATVGSENAARVAKSKPRVTRADILVAASLQRDTLRAGWQHIRALDDGSQPATQSAEKHGSVRVVAANGRYAIRHAIRQGLDDRC